MVSDRHRLRQSGNDEYAPCNFSNGTGLAELEQLISF